MTTIRLRRDGPYVVEDHDVVVLDWNGEPYALGRRPVALCRCGASASKPFCDGSHARAGFEGGPSASGSGRPTGRDPD